MHDLQDVFVSMVLSECIYKAVDVGEERAAQVTMRLEEARRRTSLL